jgi:hypothetical protein
MFYHVKELQFNARVSGPDPRFASLLLEQFGGANGELAAAMRYFVQAFSARQPYPDKYDLLMDSRPRSSATSRSSARPSRCCSTGSTASSRTPPSAAT